MQTCTCMHDWTLSVTYIQLVLCGYRRIHNHNHTLYRPQLSAIFSSHCTVRRLCLATIIELFDQLVLYMYIPTYVLIYTHMHIHIYTHACTYSCTYTLMYGYVVCTQCHAVCDQSLKLASWNELLIEHYPTKSLEIAKLAWTNESDIKAHMYCQTTSIKVLPNTSNS